MAEHIGRVVDVSASHYNHISAALTQDSKVFMWGYVCKAPNPHYTVANASLFRQCHGQSVSTPTATPFHSLHEVFACFSSPAVTHVPMATEVSSNQSVLHSLRLAFDDSTTSDVTFVVENKEIHVHKALLKIRCEHFRSMFQVIFYHVLSQI